MLDWHGEPSQFSVVIGAWVSGPLMTWETVSTEVRGGRRRLPVCSQSRKALSVSSSIGPQSLMQLV